MMKTTILKAAPFLALATFALGQNTTPKAASLTPPPASETPATLEPPATPTLNLTFQGGPLQGALEVVQDALAQAKMPPLNVVVTVGKETAVTVPALTLQNVTGADALTLIATAARLELRPIYGAEQSNIIGWEIGLPQQPVPYYAANFQPAGSTNTPGLGGTGSPSRPGLPGGTGAPVRPPTILRVQSLPPNGLGGAPQPGSEAVPALRAEISDVPVTGEIFQATSGLPGLPPPLPPAPLLTPPSLDVRETRIYALGTVTSYAGFADVEKTLRDILDTDGVKTNDVKLSFHEKTNVLVASGTPKTHALIEQLLQALGKDSAVRDNQQRTTEVRNLQDAVDRREVALKQLEIQLQDVRKTAQDSEAARVKAEMELKLLKEHAPGR